LSDQDIKKIRKELVKKPRKNDPSSRKQEMIHLALLQKKTKMIRVGGKKRPK
jgi:hypothetical protein